MARPSLTRAHRVLLGVVAGGACVISGIGFAGSYNAVRELAVQKGFGAFAYAFPVGVDAGIVVLLSLDLVLTWLRIPFPLLRQTAWLLTAATIAFNAAASWGDALGMAMHAVIPVLFVVIVEASRHAVGRIAAITADRYMESVRLMRWILSPVPTFRLWRRMKLWELRSYDETVRLEQNRLVYRAQLRFRYGRGWRRSAPFQALLPLKLAKYGVPLDPTILDRIDGPLEMVSAQQTGAAGEGPLSAAVAGSALAKLAAVRLRDSQEHGADPAPVQAQAGLNVWNPKSMGVQSQQSDVAGPARTPGQQSPWFKAPRVPRPAPEQPALTAGGPQQRAPRPVQPQQPQPRPKPQQQAGLLAAAQQAAAARQALRVANDEPSDRPEPQVVEDAVVAMPLPFTEADTAAEESPAAEPAATASEVPALNVDQCFDAFIGFTDQHGYQPSAKHLADYLTREYGVAGSRPDGSVDPQDVEKLWEELESRFVSSGRDA